MEHSPPLVTVILPTHNRPGTLASAIDSVLRQTFHAWELLVINDGGIDVKPMVEGFGDSRLRYVSFPANQGKAVCCNRGLEMALGNLIAYLDDDDTWYPNHLEVLTGVFSENPAARVAYSDLYRVGFIQDEKNHQRIPIDKKIIVSRDFNRDILFSRNHVLHVSLMHTLEAGRRVGGYDPKVTAMIDWNMVRKLAFCYDFIHVPIVTGEYYAPFEVTDRISHIQVTDQEKFKWITRRVKADQPPRPWPFVSEVEVFFDLDGPGTIPADQAAQLLDEAPYPLSLRLLDRRSNSEREGNHHMADGFPGLIDLPNVSLQAVPPGSTSIQGWRAGAEKSPADYLVLTHPGINLQELITLIYPMMEQMATGQWDMIPFGPYHQGLPPSAMVRREAVLRDGFPQKNRIGPLEADASHRIPQGFRAEHYLGLAQAAIREDRASEAVELIHRALSLDRGGPNLASRMEQLFPLYLQAGQLKEAERGLRDLIDRGYRPDNCLRLGRLLQIQGRFADALFFYQQGLEALGLQPRHLDSPVFPHLLPEASDAFTALMGMGECFYQTGNLQAAEQMFWMARKINYKSPKPYRAYAAILKDTGRLDEARTIVAQADRLTGDPSLEP